MCGLGRTNSRLYRICPLLWPAHSRRCRWLSSGRVSPEYVADLPALLFIPLLWYWVGFRLDRRWRVADKAPWMALSVFTLACLSGASLPLGYTGFLPYGFVIWVITTLNVTRLTGICSGIPVNKHSSP